MLKVKTTKSASYPPRTYANAAASDLTIAFAIVFDTPGEKLTLKASAGRKYLAINVYNSSIVQAAEAIIVALEDFQRPASLNIAGNSIATFSKYLLTQQDLNSYIYQVIELATRKVMIRKIRCGGQSGADLAGAYAGYHNGIKVTILMPAGYLTRSSDGKDVRQTQEQVRQAVASK